MSTVSKPAAAAAGGMVLVTLASSQFLMALDASVMNVSIASVANDLGTTVTGVQTAITAYTLVMASLMITGGKVGGVDRSQASVPDRDGRLRRGLAYDGTGAEPTVLIIGWSGLEGIGAALIMPAVVALVASNFPSDRRTAAYGAVAAAGAIAVAAGPIIGGAVTTSFSWRWVFVGEVFVAMRILVLAGRLADPPLEERQRIDFVGVLLSIIGPRRGRARRVEVQRLGVGHAEAGGDDGARAVADDLDGLRRAGRALAAVPLGVARRSPGCGPVDPPRPRPESPACVTS